MFENKSLWHGIGSIYIAVGFAVLAKRFATIAHWDLKEAGYEYQEKIENRFDSFKAA